jgi:hypothetical protein
MSSGEDTTLQCPICSDDMSLSVLSINDRVLRMQCCNQLLCQGCLYQHLRCMLDEGRTGQGRCCLKCPFGCGSDITDEDIRSTFTRANTDIFRILKDLTMFAFLPEFYNSWLKMRNRPLGLEQDLIRYEQWNIAVGLRKQPVMRCIVPGCDYQWISNQTYREYKQSHEAKNHILWYKPPKPDTLGSFIWVEPEYVNLEAAQNFEETDKSDGRRMVCAKCLTCFCGLCRRPWEVRSRSHSKKACATYRQKIPFRSEDTDFEFVAQLANARTCPGCSLRTQRIDGCNHMTCPCGCEWCYICERRWNVDHYSCRDRRMRSQSTCFIS